MQLLDSNRRHKVETKNIVKMIALNGGIVAANIIIFSEGLLHVKIGSSAFETAAGITAGVMSVAVFAVGNNQLLFEKPIKIQATEIKTLEDCVNALKQNRTKRTFDRDILQILEQIDRFNKKKQTIISILLQKFDQKEMSFSKFEQAVLDVENVFYMNIKSILNRIGAFDEEDYYRLNLDKDLKRFSKEFIDTKMTIYQEYITFVKNAVEDSEEILLKLDKLLFEISKFNSLEDGEIENMAAMKEIDELISKTQFYK